MPQHIVVTENSLDWTAKFDEESKSIKNILKDNRIVIHHIGSTAVTGLFLLLAVVPRRIIFK